MLLSPCKDCTDRTIGCHSSCETYKGFKEKSEAQRQERYERNDKEQAFSDHMQLSKRRMKDGKHSALLQCHLK